MKRDPYWQGRFERWQMWHYTARGGLVSGAWLQERVDCARPTGEVVACGDAEAMETERAVAALPGPLRKTVKSYYLDRVGNSDEGYARQLGISRETLRTRLCHADLRCARWLDEKKNFGEKAKHADNAHARQSLRLCGASPSSARDSELTGRSPGPTFLA